jgi:hypothetical protein
MKFASLLIDMNFIGQAEPRSTQRMVGEYKPAFMHSKAGTFNSTDDFTG